MGVALILASGTDETAKPVAVSALALLLAFDETARAKSTDETTKPVAAMIVDAGGVEPLVALLLASGTDETAKPVAASLALLLAFDAKSTDETTKPVAVMIVDAGGVEPLVALLLASGTDETAKPV